MRYTAAQRLDRLPETGFHRRLATMIGLGLFFDAFDLYIASGVMVALTSTGFATTASNAQFASAGALGALIGAFFAGWLGDRYGRKFAFQFNLVLFGVMSLLAAVAPSMPWLIAARFLMGIGLGAEIVVGYATISEFVPPAKRGKWGAILFFCATSALVVSHTVGYFVIPNLGWRWMFVIAGVGGLVVWYLRKFMPESPRWLESKGRIDEADRILDRIEATVQHEHGKALPQPSPVVDEPQVIQGSFLDLFRHPMLKSTIVGMVLNVVSLATLYGFIIWMPTFLVKQGLSVSSSIGHSAVMALGSLVGVALAGYVSDKLSRKRLVAAVSIIAALLGLAYPYAENVAQTTALGLCLMTVLYFGGTIGFSTYVPEIFPTAVRLRGAGLSSMAGRAASVVAPQVVAILFAASGVMGVTQVLAVMLFLQAVIVLMLGPNVTAQRGRKAERLRATME